MKHCIIVAIFVRYQYCTREALNRSIVLQAQNCLIEVISTKDIVGKMRGLRGVCYMFET